jgi:hypothetical protein
MLDNVSASLLTLQTSKLECLYIKNIFHSSLIFVFKAEAYQSETLNQRTLTEGGRLGAVDLLVPTSLDKPILY